MRSYGYTYQPGKRIQDKKDARKPLRNLFFLCTFILLVYILGSFVFKFFTSTGAISSIISPVTAGVNALQRFVNHDNLESTVKKSFIGTTGTYAVAIKNLKTGESYYYNQDQEFQTASLYKLWVMGAIFQLIQQKKLDLDKTLSYDIDTLNTKFDIASEDAELTDGTFEMTVGQALNQMITISHNYSALALTQQVKLSNLVLYIKNIGLSSSQVGSIPMTTASDVEYFYEKLYSGQLGNKDITNQMLTLLKNQQINDRLPKYLPDSMVIAHKTGELNEYKHDAGIVYAPRGNYIIVVMSKTDDENKAAEQEALLSKAVYDYFENR